LISKTGGINKIMDRFSAETSLQGAQDILDVASYITAMPMTLEGGITLEPL